MCLIGKKKRLRDYSAGRGVNHIPKEDEKNVPLFVNILFSFIFGGFAPSACDAARPIDGAHVGMSYVIKLQFGTHTQQRRHHGICLKRAGWLVRAGDGWGGDGKWGKNWSK